jgi:hypothetical protein
MLRTRAALARDFVRGGGLGLWLMTLSPSSLFGHLVQAELVTSVVERAPERMTFAVADLDPFLQCRRSSSLVRDLPNDAHCALLVGRPKQVAHCVNLGFAEPLTRAANEFEPQPQLDPLNCRSRCALLIPTPTCDANRLTSRSTTELAAGHLAKTVPRPRIAIVAVSPTGVMTRMAKRPLAIKRRESPGSSRRKR